MGTDIEQIAPTPWLGHDRFPGIILEARGNWVCTCQVGEGPQIDLRRDRIIACVNACVGASTHELEDALQLAMQSRHTRGRPEGDQARQSASTARANVLAKLLTFFPDARYRTTERCQRALARGETVLEQVWSKVPDAQPQPPTGAGFATMSALAKGLVQVSQLPGAKGDSDG